LLLILLPAYEAEVLPLHYRKKDLMKRGDDQCYTLLLILLPAYEAEVLPLHYRKKDLMKRGYDQCYTLLMNPRSNKLKIQRATLHQLSDNRVWQIQRRQHVPQCNNPLIYV
jgi:hypothetical protein